MHIQLRTARARAAALASMILAGLAIAAPAQAAAISTAPASLAPSALLLSGQPKTVVINPATGAVLSVTAGITRPLITQHSTCDPSWACWMSGKIPYANVGFTGSAGTKTGTWAYRSEFDTGSYHASACYSYSGSHCTPEGGPYTAFTFGGTLVTGTSARIY